MCILCKQFRDVLVRKFASVVQPSSADTGRPRVVERCPDPNTTKFASVVQW